MDKQKQGNPYSPPGNAPPRPQGVHPSAPSAPPAPGSKEPSYGFPRVPPQPHYQQGYQGYFYQGCPPPPPHQCIPPPHCHHHHKSHCHSYATISLEECLYALCCFCCWFEDRCL